MPNKFAGANSRFVAVILLDRLLQEKRIKIGDHIWLLSDDNRLGVLGHRYKIEGEIEEDVVLVCDLPISEFIKLADKMTEEEKFDMVMQYTVGELSRIWSGLPKRNGK